MPRKIVPADSNKFSGEDRFRLVIEAAPSGMIMVDEKGKIVLVNTQVERLFGYNREELLGQTIELLVPAGARDKHPEYRDSYFAKPVTRSMGIGRDLYGLHKNGTQIPVEIGLNPLVAEGIRYVLASVVDITERKRAEQRLRLVVEAAPSGMIMVDEKGTIVLVNTQVEVLFGYDREELLGQSIELLVPETARAKHPSYRDKFMEEPKARSMGVGRDLFGLRKDGSKVPVEIGLNPLETEGKHFVLASVVDITQRKAAEQELLRAKEELELRVQERTGELVLINKELITATDQAQMASKMKSEFVANMSHEIRTPMNAIIGMSNALMKSSLDEQQVGFANAIKDAGHALLTVINDILDFSKIEAGKLEIEVVDFDLARAVESACELLVIHARSKKLSLSVFVDPSIPERLSGDPERIRQILINLASNAIKFSDRGEVLIRAVLESTQNGLVRVRFSITDSGIGLNKDEQERLFQPFVQADGSISRKFGGTGLGLSICKRLVELMDGSIGVASTKGKGSTFWVSIPFEVRSANAIINPKEELQSVRLLIVDPQESTREIIGAYASAFGMKTSSCETAKEALRLLRQAYVDGDQYKILLTGLQLPDKTGIDLARDVFQDLALATTNMILLTAHDALGLGTQAIELGFKAYLTTPVTQSQLLNSVLRIVTGGKALISRSSLDVQTRKIKREALILVCDDHAVNQQVAQLYLDELGFQSHVVCNGQEALEAVSNNAYDLVLMDCQMPELDGLSATREIRKVEASRGGHVPIIAMTAHAMEGDREKCIAAGMDDYISKPMDPDQLRQALDRWLPLDQSKSPVQPEVEPTIRGLSERRIKSIDTDALLSRHKIHTGLIFRTFLNDVPAQLDKLRRTAVSRNSTELLEHAHGLKGICATVSALRMLEICKQMEAAGQHLIWDEVSELVEQLIAEFSVVREAYPTIEYKSEYQARSREDASAEHALKILIVEDQQVARLGLRLSLAEFPELCVVGEAENGIDAVKLAQELAPHVILMDIGLPGIDGIEATRQIKAACSDARVMMLTSRDHDNEVFAAFSAGADGYCLKESSAEQIATAIHAIREGVAWLDPVIAKRALRACAPSAETSAQETGKRPSVKTALTERELEVLNSIVQGMSNKQIAEKLVISVDTVKNHMRYVLAKLAVADRTQAAVKALREGLLEGYTRV